RLSDIGKIEMTRLFSHARMEDDLEEEVAQFFLQRRHVVAFNRIGDSVGFLDRVGRDGGEALLGVPWAAMLAVAQPRHQRHKPARSRANALGLHVSGHFLPSWSSLDDLFRPRFSLASIFFGLGLLWPRSSLASVFSGLDLLWPRSSLASLTPPAPRRPRDAP